MTSHWIREATKAPIGELYSEPLGEGEVAFIYLGWAGILMRTRGHAFAFDLCQKNFKRGEVKELERLDVQCYGHTHWDHWHAPHAKAILKGTGAPILIEPAIIEELGSLPREDVTPLLPSAPFRVADITVKGVVGVHPRPITLFHVETPDLAAFHGGDSGHVPLDGLAADIAFVPTGVPSPSCTPESAVAMIRDLGAKVAVAVHGSEKDMAAFRALAEAKVPETQLFIPRPCELLKVKLAG